ncbi:CRISPR-associated endoribonuclease Cas6 [Proteiniborus sp. MB09-C3]|uniref:CRISPR-associated endoribonuclease Cas6 n=1 Tax=Proteiniborus sp. MB09-C3 TaxID=3050072 RepID=UPI0025574315|nr:CRISPR-associated endoribonuclease Cas6 [Proteiniborus sp. MB09-C3]WIV11671.1 CRISPR-associated endoribonuclease Cas6 [Proteiniborus sp. MB09-C3]
MRYNVELILSNENIPKDKNRIIISLLKHIYESYDKDYYVSLYENEENKSKSFAFSLYMPNCEFTREEIIIPNKKIILNFATADMRDGILFYNAALANKGKPYKVKDNSITINRINMNKEKIITNDYAVYSSMSPVVVREHKGDNEKTWYHSLNEEKGKEIFIENIKYQLLDSFGEERRLDIEEVDFQVLINKEVKVKHYGIEILSNICMIKVQAKPYILDYIYKSGIGSKRNSGFGMLDLV